MSDKAPEAEGFAVLDSGKRQQFASGMVRDTSEDKVRYHRVFDGPLFWRWAEHLHKGAIKYPDVAPGVANWTLACTVEEFWRFHESYYSHQAKWEKGWTDEDHAAAMVFNLNGMEYVKEVLGYDPRQRRDEFLAEHRRKHREGGSDGSG